MRRRPVATPTTRRSIRISCSKKKRSSSQSRRIFLAPAPLSPTLITHNGVAAFSPTSKMCCWRVAVGPGLPGLPGMS